jgi:thermitase
MIKMNGRIISLAVILAMILTSFGAVSLGLDDIGTTNSDDYVPGELLVGFTDEIDVSKLEVGGNDPVLGFKVIEVLDSINVVLVEVPEGKEDLFISRYQASALVEYAETNGIVRLSYPDDPGWERQWGPKNIKCPEPGGWSGAGTTSTVIAIIDTGVDLDHEDLENRLWKDNLGRHGKDCFNNDFNPDDDNGHGTHCAGIAAAITDNGKGIAGVAGEAPVKIMAVKVLGGDGSGTHGTVAAGINYAANNGADVISLSLGGSSSSTTVKSACKAAYNKDIVIVAAAGNDGVTTKHYPAGYDDYVIAVAAINSDNERAYFSNYGDWVDIAAPGVNILSCFKGGGYDSFSGTSMACPHVAGVAALGKTRTGWDLDKIWEKLEECADDVVGDFVSWGKVDATYDYGGEEEPPSEIKVEVTIHEIEQKDRIDWDEGFPGYGDGRPGELFYDLKTVSSEEVRHRYNFDFTSALMNNISEAGIKYYKHDWRHSDTWGMGGGGLTYCFDVYGKDSTMDISIKLMDDDETSNNIWDFGNDVSDISSRPAGNSNDDGKTFRTTYDLVTDALDEDKDESEPTGSEYFPRYTDGGMDGTDGPENDLNPLEWGIDDARLEFSISDNYIFDDYEPGLADNLVLNFGNQRNEAVITQSLRIDNRAPDDPLGLEHDDLTWDADEGLHWLTLDKESGTIKAGEASHINVKVECEHLNKGENSALFWLKDENNNRVEVKVVINVAKAKTHNLPFYEILQSRFPQLFKLLSSLPILQLIQNIPQFFNK